MKSRLILKGLAFSSLLLAGALAHGFGPICGGGYVYDDCSGPSVGPGPCEPGCKPPGSGGGPINPVGPVEMCLGSAGCFPVSYRVDGGFVIAESVLPNGYRTMGWAGPCAGPLAGCPDIGAQAFTDLRQNALRINRGLRHSVD